MPMPEACLEALKKSTKIKKKPVSKTKKAGLTLPVHRIFKKMKKGNYAEKCKVGGAVYLTAVMEYLCAEVLELAGESASNHKKRRIHPRHIMFAIKNDSELDQLIGNVTIAEGGVIPHIHSVLLPKKKPRRHDDDE